nr:neuropeptide [Hymenolepis microstoma]
MTTLVLGTESRYIRTDADDLFSINDEISLDRKPVFRNVQELRRYLEQLDEWLAITGRPRFG